MKINCMHNNIKTGEKFKPNFAQILSMNFSGFHYLQEHILHS